MEDMLFLGKHPLSRHRLEKCKLSYNMFGACVGGNVYRVDGKGSSSTHSSYVCT